jgi:hypothetical protein
MTKVNFTEAVSRIKRLLSPIEPLMISGGEPTLHADWAWMVEEACRRMEGPVFFMTNGTWILQDEGRAFISREWRRLKRRYPSRLYGQARTHPEYYPRHKDLWARKKDLEELGFMVFDDEIRIIPLGNAKWMAPGVRFPSCVNYRLALKQQKFLSLGELLRAVRVVSKVDHCKPLIDDKGDLYLGESNLCFRIGNVLNEPEDTLFQRALTELEACKGCGPELDRSYREFLIARGLEKSALFTRRVTVACI